MPVDLGWCDSYQTDYAERCCKVRFITDNKTKEITIIQSPHSVANGNSPYYQWGRKDPFPPSNGSDNSNKTWYTADGTPSDASPTTKNLSTSLDCIKNYILNPNVMHDQKEGGVYTNLWSVNNNTSIPNDAEVVKTIYDPCPVGFKLPVGNAFTGFTTTGKETTITDQINGSWDNTKKGWNIYTNSTKDKTIFFPASGFRDYSSGKVQEVGQTGYWWLAIPNDRLRGYAMGCSSEKVTPVRVSWNTYGNKIRPSQE